MSSSASTIAAPASGPTIWSASSSASTPTGRKAASAPTPALACRSRSRSSRRTSGRIWAENRYGKAGRDGEKPVLGARFIVRIPAAATMHEEALIHGTCLAIGGDGRAAAGPARVRQVRPGAAPDRPVGHAASQARLRSARLVADDQVAVRSAAATAHAPRPPRHLRASSRSAASASSSLPAQAEAALRLAVRLTPAAEIERLPDLDARPHGDPRHRHSAGPDRPRKRLGAGPHQGRAGPSRARAEWHVASHPG